MGTLNKLSRDEIIAQLSTNTCGWKARALSMIDDIAAVNDTMTDDDISTLCNDSAFYDALHDYSYPFSDLLDDAYMHHLNIEQNNNDVMIFLQMIYS